MSLSHAISTKIGQASGGGDRHCPNDLLNVINPLFGGSPCQAVSGCDLIKRSRHIAVNENPIARNLDLIKGGDDAANAKFP